MTGPDVRWDGVSHGQIVDWVGRGRGAAVTEILEDRLRSVAEALSANADRVNGILQKVHGGEWTGNAATVAAQAMRVLRDFDDTMRHHGVTNHLAAFGQSDNSSWVRASVPPLVDLWPALQPSGGPLDVLSSTEDMYDRLRAAKDAEEQARRVMREYETMTVERVTSLPPLAPAPQVVVDGHEDTIVVAPVDHVVPRDHGRDEGGGPRRTEDDPQPSGGTDRPPVGDRRGSSEHGLVGGGPGRTDAASASFPVGGGGNSAAPGGGGHSAAPTRPVGGTEFVAPGDRVSGPGDRRGFVEVVRRGRYGGLNGFAPVAGQRRSDEDTEHENRYAVPESTIFEPDNVGGLFYDPFRPGSFVVPGSIGDDDDE